ncbi:hypothetical protein [uncultured Aquimarina sp.]|uniref:hypothetical protein n=1 Tax=uncultured Aquimarina sp. TaxID=575652 RepID=UPI002639226C|nr:hypothetical protein [uncultured Aquimarina sp.]
MISRLKNNISELYKTFEKYHSEPTMLGSSLYDDLDKWNKELFSKSLTELNEDDLSRFVGKVMTTWGNANDYKHFLPRIFELTAEFKTPYEIWITFDKLTLAEWNSWDENEQKVIHEFMIALWENIVNDDSEKAECEFKDYFSAIANFYPNFDELIAIWSESESKGAIKHFSNFIINEQTAIFDRKKISGFYDKTENVQEFISWALSDKTLNKIQRKYFQFENESFAEKISWAEQIITTERKSTAHNNV